MSGRAVSVWCDDFREALPERGIPACCGSCHSEWADGYGSPFDAHPPHRHSPRSEDERVVGWSCCSVAVSDLTRAEWAKVVRHKRAREHREEQPGLTPPRPHEEATGA